MHNDFWIGLIYNTTLLLSLSMIYAIFPLTSKTYPFFKSIFLGIVVSFVGFGIMSNPIPLIDGIFFDARSILVSTTGMFFGPIPTIIVISFTSFFRFSQGGTGAITGILVILFSGIIGLLWHHFRLNNLTKNTKKCIFFELYLFGLIVHIGMLLLMFNLGSVSLFVIGKIFFPIIIIYPIGSVILCIIILNQLEKSIIQDDLKKSEEKFKIYMEKAPYAIFTFDQNGDYLQSNPQASILTGYTHQEILTINILDLLPAKDFKKAQRAFLKVLKLGYSELKLHYLTKNSIIRECDIKLVQLSNNYILASAEDITDSEEKKRRIESLSFRDQLTDVYNRRFFEDTLHQIDHAPNLPLTLIMADVNSLKLINDAFGHQSGDLLLKKSADILKMTCRKNDIISRIGGDEFVILMPATTSEDAYSLIQDIRTLVSKEKINDIDISISFGIATKYDMNESISTIYKDAEDNMYKNKLFESSNIKDNMITTIINTLHEKNKREKEHSERVSHLCQRIGESLNLNLEAINELRISGLLHDIGKVALDESLLNKPEKLSDYEYIQIQSHPDIGYRILSSVNNLSILAEYVLAHHERWDGKGYPKGLKSDKIPFNSRIIALADSYDAMTSERPYKNTMNQESAIKELIINKGKQFDPDLTDLFVEQVLLKTS